MQQKLIGASVSLLIVSVLLCHFHLLPALSSRMCRRDVFYMKNAVALNYLANGFEETCPSGSMQFEHHPTGDELWETKVSSAPQRPLRILNPSSKRIFRSITVSGVRRGYGHGNEHKEQKRKQYPLPSSQILQSQISASKGSHTIPPEYNYEANNNDNEKRNKHPPQLYREKPLHLPLEIKHTTQPLYTPYKQLGQQQRPQKLSLSKSNNNNTSSPIHPTSPSTAPSRPSTPKEAQLLNRPSFLVTVVQQGPDQWHCNHTHHHLSSTADKLLDSQISSSHHSSSPLSSSSSSSSSSPLCATGGRFLSRDNEIRGSFLGMVVCVVVSVMWI
ncbi:hypothetical protein EMPG_16218 [Blastomyces silverae]|uniref:Uncharacterized protein n=1 Tax=Blastomyces silverae TaxID=2060906 RepID=A0A0H1BB92_9EURO|nr:hypothetical protein EMPG_16218 [Blastomyces silverae]